MMIDDGASAGIMGHCIIPAREKCKKPRLRAGGPSTPRLQAQALMLNPLLLLCLMDCRLEKYDAVGRTNCAGTHCDKMRDGHATVSLLACQSS